MPIIILEGIDGGGKSTLARHLTAVSPWLPTITHRGPIKTSIIEELIQPLFDVEPDELLIADRWHLSELIYGPLYRGKSQIDEEILGEIEAVLKELNAVRIIVSSPLAEISHRLETRGEDFLKPGHQRLVHSAFLGLAEDLNYIVVESTTRGTATAIIEGLTSKVMSR